MNATYGELSEWLVKKAKQYRKQGVLESIKRNRHMNNYNGDVVSQDTIDAILVDFVNFAVLPMDLAMYTEDLEEEC